MVACYVSAVLVVNSVRASGFELPKHPKPKAWPRLKSTMCVFSCGHASMSFCARLAPNTSGISLQLFLQQLACYRSRSRSWDECGMAERLERLLDVSGECLGLFEKARGSVLMGLCCSSFQWTVDPSLFLRRWQWFWGTWQCLFSRWCVFPRRCRLR